MTKPPTAYVPILALPYWDTIGPFVDAVVADCLPHTQRRDRDLYAAAVPMVLWCWRARGTPLERARIFRTTMIDQFIHLGMPGAARGSQATLRATLWRIAEILNPDQADAPHRPIARSAPTRPYSATEIADLVSWASTQATPGRRRDARTMLALGLGAGLAARELLDVQTTDVVIDTTGDVPTARIVVWQNRTRVIPVTPDWVAPLRQTLLEVPAGSWLFRPGRQTATPGQITDFLTRSRSPLDVRPVRMRATWLIQHLAEGTPAEEVLRISGLKNFAALDRFAPMIPKRDP
ncbi:hypothetical protein [Salinibacterium sp. GXW1014]|uniref:hypothetical protein n=1 Tax=Salinibacterium sp. GXW1014 TaxID=3377838 RepID=UPI00383B11BB